MTETAHTRSRRASLYGLLFQVVVSAAIFALAHVVGSVGMLVLSFYCAGGAVIWLTALLLFRQRELAALEALDLEELRRERRAAGGGEALFGEEGGVALGLRVAENRLKWMQRWLVPALGLVTAAYLGGTGLALWYLLGRLYAQQPPSTANLPLAMFVLAVIMLLGFLYARYTSGMGRVAEWQLLRACGSYLLGNALLTAGLLLCLGISMYAQTDKPEKVLAHVIPVVMIVLAVEVLLNFVLDIYRPRAPGVEPRAAFDSRLLGLISEPGGLVSTIAEAVNYQFGFEVSKTWFYQLLQRTAVLLLAGGVAVLWLTTSMLVVQPGQHALVERFGRQLNADRPYPPGFYWKLPWPIDVVRTYETGRLHQFVVGFKQFDAVAEYDLPGAGRAPVALWTDEKHLGHAHFDFLVPTPGAPSPVETAPADRWAGPGVAAVAALPVNLVRMDVAVQYQIRADQLAAYSRQMVNPDDTLLDIAWGEVGRYLAATDLFALLGEKYGVIGAELKERMARRVEELKLGLEVVWVGVQNVHPEPGVAREFRKVVQAEQEQIAAVRQALVKENQVLSAVAGDREQALALAQAAAPILHNENLLQHAERVLEGFEAAPVQALTERLAEAQPELVAVVEARWRLETAQRLGEQIALDVQAGLGRTLAERERAEARVRQAQQDLAAAQAALDQALAPLLAEARDRLGDTAAAALRDVALARGALEFYNARVAELLPRLKGEAAAILARAQAERWTIEMRDAAQVAQLEGEREAFRAAPRVYKLRSFLEVLREGLKDSRKFFLAFDPQGRTIRLRIQAEEQARPEDIDVRARMAP